MKTIKLSKWCEKSGISYLTAWRWFKKDKMPVRAYQTNSGTILVEIEEDNNDQVEQHDATSLFFKKTIEYGNNKSTVEDFAAYIFSTFNLSIKEKESVPRYSKNKPRPEEIQDHFKRFIPTKGPKPEPNMYIPDAETLESLASKDEPVTVVNSTSPIVSEEIINLQSNYSTLLSSTGSSFDGSFKLNEKVHPLAYSASLDGTFGATSLSLDASTDGLVASNGLLASGAGIYYTNNQVPTLTDIDKPKRGRPKKKAE